MNHYYFHRRPPDAPSATFAADDSTDPCSSVDVAAGRNASAAEVADETGASHRLPDTSSGGQRTWDLQQTTQMLELRMELSATEASHPFKVSLRPRQRRLRQTRRQQQL